MERDGETKNPLHTDLHRVLTLSHAVAIYVSSLLGSGIFVIPGLAARIAGPASIISWILLSLASYPFAYTFAKLSARNPESGGIYAFAREGLGRGASAATAWLFLAWAVLGAPAATVAAASYLTFVLPLNRSDVFLVAAAILIGAFGVNYLGIRFTGRVQVATVVAILAAFVTFGTVNAYVAGMARVYYAAARDGVFPEALGKVDPKTGAPRRSLVFLIVMVLLSLAAFYFLNVEFVSAFLMASGAAILTYVIGSVAGIRLLRERGMRRILPWISLVVSVALLPFILTALLLSFLLGGGDVGSRGNFVMAAAGEVRVEGGLRMFDRLQAGGLHRHGIGDEEVAVRVLVDQLPVLGVQGLRGHFDVVQAQAEGEHELPQGGRPYAPAAQGLQGPRPRVVDPGQVARGDLLPISGLRQFQVLESQDAEVDELRSSPDPEDVPDPRLHLVLHYEVLPAEDVRHAEQGIIDGPGELQHRPHSVAVADARMVPLCDPEQYAIPEGRVRVRHVCLEADDGLPLGVFAGEHRLPHRDRLVHALDAVDAGFHRLAVLAERLRVALADVGLARREELLRPLVVQGDAVALVEDLVELDAGPVQTFPDLVERLGEEGLVFRSDRVVEDEEELAVVLLRVRVIQDERPRVPNVEGAARVRREAKDDLAVDGVRERREFLRAHPGRRPFEEFRSDRGQFRPLRLGREAVHVRDDALHMVRDFLCASTQARVLCEHPSKDRLGVRFPSMKNGILQDELSGGFEAHERPNRSRV